MNSYVTDYGKLEAISLCTTYEDNQLKDCVVNEKTDLHTPLGILTPQYEHAGVRRKYTSSVSFFPGGKLSRIALHEQTNVETPIGILPAELITFYESGGIKKLFPLNGQLSGYWEESDELALAQEFHFDFPFGSFDAKIIGIGFYENRAVHSLTLWPGEVIAIRTPIGEQQVRTGFSLYPDGKLKSVEPVEPVEAATPIGPISAYDINATGLSADSNSLKFNMDGSIRSLISSSTKITVPEAGKTYTPRYIGDIAEYDVYFQPLKIEFINGKVRFNGQDEYNNGNSFRVEAFNEIRQGGCSNCSSCNRCASCK